MSRTEEQHRLACRILAGSLILLACLAPAGAAERIKLDAEMLVNLSGQRPAAELIDEQDVAGDPRDGSAARPETSYSNGWMNQKLYYPLSVAIDLGVEHDLTDVCHYDGQGSALLTVAYRHGDRWQELSRTS